MYTEPQLVEIIRELVEHLDYIGWGDSYERENVAGEDQLEGRANAVLQAYEQDEETFHD